MLKKLKIEAYEDETFGSKIGEWSAQINPEAYHHTHRTLFAKDDGIDTAGTVSRYRSIDAEEITFTAILDATGVVEDVDNVSQKIDELKAVAYRYNGDIHAPNYLRLLWGELVFNCRLLNLDISYVVFTPAGEPLRARLSFTVRQHQTPREIAERARRNSPDRAHVREMTAGTSVWLFCSQIYRNPLYTVAVARHNGMTSFRRVRTGRTVAFPPLGRPT